MTEKPVDILTGFGHLADVHELGNLIQQFGVSDFVARTLLRSLFSILDGFSCSVRTAEWMSVRLTESEIDMINEVRTVVLRDGSLKKVRRITSTKDNIVFALSVYARSRGVAAPFSAETIPACYAIAARARNRITHPRDVSDLTLSSEERDAADQLLRWVTEIMEWAVQEDIKTLDHILDYVKILGTQIREQKSPK